MKYSLNKIVAFAIVIISTIVALSLVSGLFRPGIPLNIDLPVHYERFWCYKEAGIWSLPNTWCPYYGAGIPTFNLYPILPFEIMSFFSYLLSIELSFKIALVIIYLLLPIATFILLYKIGQPLAGAFTYAFLLFEHGGWYNGGFNQIFLVGMFATALGSAMLILALAFAVLFFKDPNKKNMVFASITAALLILAHPSPFVFYIICAIILLAMYWKNVLKEIKLFIIFPLVTLALVSFWLIPYLIFKSYAMTSPGGSLPWEFFVSYFWNPINKAAFFLGAISFIIVVLLMHKRKEIRFLAYCILAVVGLFVLGFVFPKFFDNFFLFKYLILLREAAELRTFLVIFLGLALGLLATIKMNVNGKKVPAGLIIALLVGVVLSVNMLKDTRAESGGFLLSEMQPFKYQEGVYSLLKKPGRVMTEETLYNFPFRMGESNSIAPQNFAHPFCIGPIITKKEILGCPNYFYVNKPYEDSTKNLIKLIPEKNFSDYVEKAGIKYVILHSPESIQRFQNYSFIVNVSEYPPWKVYETNVSGSHFSIGSGKITSEEYRGTYAKVEVVADKDSILQFKVREFPRWKATLDGKSIKIRQNKDMLMEIDVPKGNHAVSFKYTLSILDYLGYIISAVGIAIILWILFSDQRRKNNKPK